MSFQTLTTASGLAIVPVRPEHAPMLAQLVGRDHDHLRAFIPHVAGLSTVEAASAHLVGAVERAAAGEIVEWHLFDGPVLCGAIRLKDIDRADRKAAIGYFLGSEFGGKGILTEAARAVLDWSFASFGLNRVELRCAASNVRSVRVAERLGFVREGLLRHDECLNGVFVDHYVYGLLAAEFRR